MRILMYAVLATAVTVATLWWTMPVSDAADAEAPPGKAHAVLAGGCFWCMEADFEKLTGVQEVVSGYAGGTVQNPTYKQVAYGKTDHGDAVRITYDPSVVDFDALLAHFWKNIDPTVDDRQFCDTGRHYRPVIFYLDEDQQQAAEASRQAIVDAGEVSPIKVTIESVDQFWVAEDYHQDYYKKNPLRYNYYRFSCGRDARLKELWGEDA